MTRSAACGKDRLFARFRISRNALKRERFLMLSKNAAHRV
jgi:hypothetical protein